MIKLPAYNGFWMKLWLSMFIGITIKMFWPKTDKGYNVHFTSSFPIRLLITRSYLFTVQTLNAFFSITLSAPTSSTSRAPSPLTLSYRKKLPRFFSFVIEYLRFTEKLGDIMNFHLTLFITGLFPGMCRSAHLLTLYLPMSYM